MKKEDFVALGISEELAVKAEQESKKELEGYVPKTDLEALNATKWQQRGAPETDYGPAGRE